MDFELKFLKKEDFNGEYCKNVGIIFRAKDLENYFMIEIKIDKNILWIKPHVRYEGMWDVMSDDKFLTEAETQKFNDDWVHLKLTVNKNTAELSIGDDKKYEWALPTHVDINHIESGIKESNNISPEQDSKFGAKVTYLPEIDFRNSSGMIGFRAHLN